MPYDGHWSLDPPPPRYFSSPLGTDEDAIWLEELANLPTLAAWARSEAIRLRALYLALDCDPRARPLADECDEWIALYVCCQAWLTETPTP